MISHVLQFAGSSVAAWRADTSAACGLPCKLLHQSGLDLRRRSPGLEPGSGTGIRQGKRLIPARRRCLAAAHGIRGGERHRDCDQTERPQRPPRPRRVSRNEPLAIARAWQRVGASAAAASSRKAAGSTGTCQIQSNAAETQNATSAAVRPAAWAARLEARPHDRPHRTSEHDRQEPDEKRKSDDSHVRERLDVERMRVLDVAVVGSPREPDELEGPGPVSCEQVMAAGRIDGGLPVLVASVTAYAPEAAYRVLVKDRSSRILEVPPSVRERRRDALRAAPRSRRQLRRLPAARAPA